MKYTALILVSCALAAFGADSVLPPGEDFVGQSVFAKLSRADAFAKASAMAQDDFGHGRLKIFVLGKRPAKNPYEDYLKEKYGVSSKAIAGCVVTDGILGAADGYNSTMKPLLNQKFGRDIFKEAEQARAAR